MSQVGDSAPEIVTRRDTDDGWKRTSLVGEKWKAVLVALADRFTPVPDVLQRTG